MKTYERKLVSLVVCVFVLLNLSSCAWTAPSSKETPTQQTAEANAPDTAFTKVYRGDFDGAKKMIRPGDENKRLAGLERVLGEYDKISVQREVARKAAYEKQLTQLERYRHPEKKTMGGTPMPRKTADVNDPNAIKSINDANDPNGLFDALLVVVKAHEVADTDQKAKLLDDPFVKEIIATSVNRCDCFEAKSQWLESLMNCYGRLAALYEDKKLYADHIEQLTGKEMVKISLQDSPCESWESHYQNVRKETFIQAVKGLEYNYVSIINYADMAEKAIKRCRLLGDVVFTVDSLRSQFLKNIDPNVYGAWNRGLDVLSAKTKAFPLGLDGEAFFDIFEKTLALNESTIKLPEKILIVHFAEASLDSLDPHTNLVWPQQLEEFKKNLTNEFSGIGVEISKADGPLKVASLLPDAPAYTSGLDAGDIIEAVDGVSTKDMPIGCAVRKITGPAGTSVTLAIVHSGETKSVNITLKRAKIVVPTIRGWQRFETGKWQYMLDKDNGIGYVRISQFSEKTDSDLENALRELESQGLKGLIIDLRFDSGGYLETAVKVVDKFVKKGLIVRTQPRFGLASYETARAKTTYRDYPLAILINGGSASASEIVAGALQDTVHKRAVLVGTRSYGKGSVQQVAPIPGGAQLKYTMAYYHLPSGQRVEGRAEMEKVGRKDWGVTPDVEVEVVSEELKKMIDVQRDNDVLVKAGHRDGATPMKRYSRAEVLAADPQLAVAELIVKAQLVDRNIPVVFDHK